jgi:hypothetical protein
MGEGKKSEDTERGYLCDPEKPTPVIGSVVQLTENPQPLPPPLTKEELLGLAEKVEKANQPIIPWAVFDAALLAARCAEPLPKEMTVEEARKELLRTVGATSDIDAWAGEITHILFDREEQLHLFLASAPLSDKQYDAAKDREAEGEANHE